MDLFRNPRSRFVYCRVWDKDLQQYSRRSTGKLTVEEAREWTIQNLAELFQLKPSQRGGGTNSIRRHIIDHLEYQRKRLDAQEISEATFICYDKNARHFIRWFADNGYKRLADIKRTSLQEYALNRSTKDGMSANTINGEVTFLRMWWKWLQDNEIIVRPIQVSKLRIGVHHRTSGEAFAKGDLERIYQAIDEFVKDSNSQVSEYNRQLFALFIRLLDQSGARQHEVHQLKWKHVAVGQTQTHRERVINHIKVPHSCKRGARVSVFRGLCLLELQGLHEDNELIEGTTPSDYLFRNEQENTPVDRSTFSRYWVAIMKKMNLSYTLHTFRAHRITQLVMSGVETHLVARNLGLSPAQIEKTYLRFAPAAHYEKLVQRDVEPDKELRRLIGKL